MNHKDKDEHDDALVKETILELKDIKGLLVLLLKKGGATQTELAKALSISQATVSTQFKFGDVKPLGAEVLNAADGEEK